MFYTTLSSFDHLKIPVKGARIAVQGFGNAGSIAAELFAAAGARIVAVSDSRGGIHAASGLDIAAVLAHAMQRFRSTLNVSGSVAEQLRKHFDGLRRLVRDEPELFAVMGELALRSARDPTVRDLFQQTVDVWRRVIRGLLVKGGKDGSLPVPRDPDAQASLVVAAVMGASMMPLGRPARLTETFRELERSLNLRAN